MFSMTLRRARRPRPTTGARQRRSLLNSATSDASTAIAAPVPVLISDSNFQSLPRSLSHCFKEEVTSLGMAIKLH